MRWATSARAAWPPPASARDAGGRGSTRDPDARVAVSVSPVPALAALERIAALPGVAAAVDEAREACTQLRWHPALRRKADSARAEAGVRAVQSSAALAGARFPLELVRNVARGADTFPEDAAGRTALGALRAHAEAEGCPGAGSGRRCRRSRACTWWLRPGWWRTTRSAVRGGPARSRARERTCSRRPALPLPAPDAAELAGRLAALGDLLAAPASVPALVVAGLVHAEIATLRPFVTGNGVVARALCRAIVIGRGLDPTGVAVWEAGCWRPVRPTRWPSPDTGRGAPRVWPGGSCSSRGRFWTARRRAGASRTPSSPGGCDRGRTRDRPHGLRGVGTAAPQDEPGEHGRDREPGGRGRDHGPGRCVRHVVQAVGESAAQRRGMTEVERRPARRRPRGAGHGRDSPRTGGRPPRAWGRRSPSRCTRSSRPGRSRAPRPARGSPPPCSPVGVEVDVTGVPAVPYGHPGRDHEVRAEHGGDGLDELGCRSSTR